MNKSIILLIVGLSQITLIGCTAAEIPSLEETMPVDNPQEYEIKETPEGIKYIIDPEKIILLEGASK